MPTGSPSPPRPILSAIRTFGLAALWVLTAAWMVSDALRDPYNPALEGTRRYGHNHEGALRDGLVVTLIELAVLHLILQPWKGGRSWLYILVALILVTPWFLFSAMMTMHAGGIFAIHALWVLAVGLSLMVALVVSVVGAVRGRRSEG